MKRLTLYIFLLTGFCNAQTRRIDSLYKLIAKDKEDTLKVNHLISISSELKHIVPDSSFAILNRAMALAQNLNVVSGQKGWLKGMANIYYQLGNIFYYNGKYDEAEAEFSKSLNISKQINPPDGGVGAAIVMGSFGQIALEKGDFAKAVELFNKSKLIFERNGNKSNLAIMDAKLARVYDVQGDFYNAIESLNRALKIFKAENDEERTAAIEGSLGNIYEKQGNFSRALEQFYKALKIFESIKDKRNAATSLMNIGAIYKTIKNYDKALQTIDQAHQIDKEIGNRKGMASDLGVMAGIYTELLQFDKALKLYEQGLQIHESMENKSGISRALSNIGSVYGDMKNDSKAIEYYLKSIALAEHNADKLVYAVALGGLGESYYSIKDFKKAEMYLLKALAIDTAIGYLEHALYTYKSLSAAYAENGNYSKSLQCYKMFAQLNDSLFNQTKSTEITKHEMSYEFEKKEAEVKSEQEKKDAVSQKDALRRSLILWLSGAVLLIVFVFAAIILQTLRKTKRQKNLIEIKSKETETQRDIIAEKNKDILDSINYAKRIQVSLLPSEKYIERKINNLLEKK